VRFSLKWALAGTFYVAIAAAAFTRGEWWYADLVWTLTFLVVVYAALIIAFTSGLRRALAAGFFIASAGFAACSIVAPESGPTIPTFLASGFKAEERPIIPPPLAFGSTVRGIRRFPSVTPSDRVNDGYSVRFRAANAVATLAFGLMGSLVGLMAFRASASGDKAKARMTG
jgi:hypothetical protein